MNDLKKPFAISFATTFIVMVIFGVLFADYSNKYHDLKNKYEPEPIEKSLEDLLIEYVSWCEELVPKIYVYYEHPEDENTYITHVFPSVDRIAIYDDFIIKHISEIRATRCEKSFTGFLEYIEADEYERKFLAYGMEYLMVRSMFTDTAEMLTPYVNK